MLGSPSSAPKCFVMSIQRYLTLKNYLFYCSGKDFCSFAFFLPCLRQHLLIFTNLDLKVLEILLSKSKMESKNEHQFLQS